MTRLALLLLTDRLAADLAERDPAALAGAVVAEELGEAQAGDEEVGAAVVREIGWREGKLRTAASKI